MSAGAGTGAAAERRPDFVLMGAAKAGTTSLHHALAAHPEIHMSAPLKEPRYFLPFPLARRHHRRHGIEVASRAELCSRFMLTGHGGEPLFGESTAEYTAGSTSRCHGVPARMAALQPRIRLLYLVRHPLARVLSHWRHLGRRGIPRPELDRLGTGVGRHERILLDTGRYAWQLEPYRRRFGAERILVVVLERLVAEPAGELARIFRFLGVDPAPGRLIDLPHLNRTVETGAPERFAPHVFARLAERLGPPAADLEPWLVGPPGEWDWSPERWVASGEAGGEGLRPSPLNGQEGVSCDSR